MRLFVLPLVSLVVLAACASTPAPALEAAPAAAAAPDAAAPADDVTAIARDFVERFLSGDHASARTQYFDETMKKALGEDQLGQIAKTLPEQAGEFRGILDVTPKNEGEYTIIFVGCDFAKQPLNLRVVFPRGGHQIAGFFIEKR
jgi:hypothetical protein